jgi:hypothetical protein
MAVQRFKVSLNNARYPLVASKAQRAVFVPGLDSAPRTPRIFMGKDENVDYDLAQVIYAENVMPVSEGVRSAGYRQLIGPTVNKDFDQLFPLRDENEFTVLYSPAKGKNYIYDDVAEQWITDPVTTTVTDLAVGSVPADSRVTYAYVDGRTFVCYSRLKSSGSPAADRSIFYWDSSLKRLLPANSLITNLPFPAGEIDGVSSANGYLIVWSNLSVAWAPFNGAAFDFIPYTNGAFTGAGTQIPEEIKGPIQAVLQVAGGFIIFTNRNAIGAHYHSQNLAAPWVFREIAGAGGLRSYEQATVESNLGGVTAYTTAGFQSINLNSSQHKHPDISDFITGRSMDRYEYGLHQIESGTSNQDLNVKVSVIGNRYITVSYGYLEGVYTHALVWDLALERWGRLRQRHVDLFYYVHRLEEQPITYGQLIDVSYSELEGERFDTLVIPPEDRVTNARHSLAFLRETGEVVVAIWSDDDRAEDPGVVVIGRIQLSRSRRVQFNRAEIEGLTSGRVYLQPSYDGRTLAPTEALIDIARVQDLAVVGGLYDCLNFNLVIEGSFALSTVIIEGTPAGSY